MANPSPEAAVLDAMLVELEKYVLALPAAPTPPPQLPSSLAIVSVIERSVGLGNRVGTDVRGPFSIAALKGLRLEAVIRYQHWATSAGAADQAIKDLIKLILKERDKLRGFGFLRIALKNSAASENVPGANAWRASVEFEVLYEFPFVDSDGAESLITQIPIEIDSEVDESLMITDEMTRWDNQTAPPLNLRGRLIIGALSALAYVPVPAPDGKVTLTRTFDGAVNPAPIHPDLPALLTAISGSNNPDRQGQFAFATLTAFLAAFSPAGDVFTLGDWEPNNVPDIYVPLALKIDPPIELPGVADRFEISYETAALNHVAVVYLRATPGTT